MIIAENLTIGYGKGPDIIKNIDFQVRAGEFAALVGPNGSGKSTILRVLARSMVPRSGHVYINKFKTQSYSSRKLAGIMAFLPQSPSAPDDFTVRDLVSYGRYPHLKWRGKMTKTDWTIVDDAIEKTHLTGLSDRMLATLSGGERQRAWLAMALAQKPKILLLDEPTTFLDICYQFEILELVKRLNHSMNMTIVAVLHDLNQASRYADRIIALSEKKIAANGPPSDVIVPEVLERIFHISVDIRIDPNYDCPYLVPLRSLKLSTM